MPDQTGAYLTSTAQSVGSAVVTAGEFGANVITGCSVVGNIAVAGYKAYHGVKTQSALTNKVGQAVDTVCKETSKTARAFCHMSGKSETLPMLREALQAL